MATCILDLNLGSVNHTVPGGFWGMGTSTFRMVNGQDADNATFRQMAANLNMEVWRAHLWGAGTGQNTTLFPDGTSEALILAGMKGMAKYLSDRGTQVMLQLNLRPNPWPFSNQPANTYNTGGGAASNLQSGSTTSGSPQSMTAVLNDWRATINLVAFEGWNEPANNRNSAGERWYQTGSGGFPGDDGSYACESFAAVHLRDVYAAVQAASPSIQTVAGVYADGTATQLAGAKNNLRGSSDFYGVTNSNLSWPHADTNFGYWDVWCCHPYAQTAAYNASDVQSAVNALYYDELGTSSNAADLPKARLASLFSRVRAWLDANGQTSKQLMFDETGLLGSTIDSSANGVLADTAAAILAMRNQARWNLSRAIYMAYSTAGDGMFTGAGVYTATLRQYAFRDMLSPFFRTYKRQLFDGSSIPWRAGSAPPNAPGGVDLNAVAAVQASFGLNATGDRLGGLVQNLDPSVTHTLVVNLGQASTGTATVIPVTSSTTAAPLSPTNLDPAGSLTVTVPLPPRSSQLVQIPVAAVVSPGGGGGGGGGTSTDPHIGNWTAAVGINAVADTPPSFNADQHIGNWADAVGVDGIDLPGNSLDLLGRRPPTTVFTP